jgi:hypothetical protein
MSSMHHPSLVARRNTLIPSVPRGLLPRPRLRRALHPVLTEPIPSPMRRGRFCFALDPSMASSWV